MVRDSETCSAQPFLVQDVDRRPYPTGSQIAQSTFGPKVGFISIQWIPKPTCQVPKIKDGSSTHDVVSTDALKAGRSWLGGLGVWA